jgi:hypothetical protein
VTGKAWTVRVEADASAAQPVDETGGRPSPGRARPGAKEEAEKLPLIRRAVEVLGATIQRVDEGFGEGEARPAGDREEA